MQFNFHIVIVMQISPFRIATVQVSSRRFNEKVWRPKPTFKRNPYEKWTTILTFIYSEKTTKFCEIFTLILSYAVPVKSKVKISQNFLAISEYMNFR